jgi:Protein of unknown function (DUF2934)
MREGKGPSTEELAYLLWEKQGRPENRSTQNWIEAQSLALSLANVTRDESEADLRMRGLGPLTQDESLRRDGDKQQAPNGSRVSGIRKPEQRVDAPSVIASCVAGTAMVVALGILFSFFRKSG